MSQTSPYSNGALVVVLSLVCGCTTSVEKSWAADGSGATSDGAQVDAVAPGVDAIADAADAIADAADAQLAGPDAADGRTALVLLLHGVGGTGSAEATSWDATAIADQAVVIAADYDRNWNASKSCCDPTLSHDDDTSLTQLVQARVAQGDIDPSRVYVMGHSNGGFMTWRLLCDHADVFRAGVIVEGAANSANDPACSPTRSMRVLHVHGTADSTVMYARSEDLYNMPDDYTPAIGPLGSTDQEATAAGCTDVLRSTGKVTAGIYIGSGSSATVADVDGFTRDCAGAADFWRVNNGPHSPTYDSTWFPAVLAWADAHR